LALTASAFTAGLTCYFARQQDAAMVAAGLVLSRCVWTAFAMAVLVASAGAAIVARWMQRPFVSSLARLKSKLIEHAGYQGRKNVGHGRADEFRQFEACLDDFLDRMQEYYDKLNEQVQRRLAIQQALGESKVLFDTFMQHLPALAFIKDDQGRYVYLNEACRRFYGQDPNQRLGKTDEELWPPEVAATMMGNDRYVLEKGQALHTVEQVEVAEGRRYYMVVKFPLNRNGTRKWVAGIAFDITDKIQAQKDKARLETQLVQAQKMEAIGTLAGGIAHDFNNILAAIMGYLEIARMDLEPGHPVQKRLEQVLEASDRAKDLVKRILTFSRKTNHDRKPIDLVTVARDALQLLRASLPATIEIEEKIEIPEAIVVADITQMHQVIMNLFTNAGHAMEAEGGRLSLELDQVVISASAKNSHIDLSPGKYVLLKVSDTGPGIPEAIRDRIFEPYFTTKGQGKGTGMGLAVVHGIVRAHSGAIALESAPGRGTTFSVYLPAAEEMLCPLPGKQERLAGGSETILFVDDEQALAELGRQMLSRLGYKVEIRASALDALAAFEHHPHKYDMVITDLTMPHMTGDVLARRLLDLRPDLPVILCTGYSDRMNQAKARQIGVAAYLLKPLSVKELAVTVRQVLDRNQPAFSRPVAAGR